MMQRAGQFEANYRHMGDLIQQFAPGRNLELIVNEWNLFYDAATIQSMEGAVYAARMMNGFEREGDVVEANSISDLLNGWVGGIIQASRDRVYGTPQYYAVQLYREHLGTDLLATAVTSPVLAEGLQALDGIATRSQDGQLLYVKMSNADAARTVPTVVDVAGISKLGVVTLDFLAAAPGKSRNTFSAPTTIVPARSTLHCSAACTLNLPPASVAILTIRLRP